MCCAPIKDMSSCHASPIATNLLFYERQINNYLAFQSLDTFWKNCNFISTFASDKISTQQIERLYCLKYEPSTPLYDFLKMYWEGQPRLMWVIYVTAIRDCDLRFLCFHVYEFYVRFLMYLINVFLKVLCSAIFVIIPKVCNGHNNPTLYFKALEISFVEEEFDLASTQIACKSNIFT